MKEPESCGSSQSDFLEDVEELFSLEEITLQPSLGNLLLAPLSACEDNCVP